MSYYRSEQLLSEPVRLSVFVAVLLIVLSIILYYAVSPDALTWFLTVVGIIGFGGLCTFAGSITATYRNHRLAHIWRTNTLRWVIIKPQYQGRMARIEDILAAEQFRDTFAKHGIAFTDLDDRKPIPVDHNIIFICGPEANQASAKIARQYPLSIEYRYDAATHLPYFFDHVENKALYSPSDQDKNEHLDLALVAKLTSRNSSSINVFCWGLHGPGTTGAARWLFEDEFLDQCRKEPPTRDFVALISVPYQTFDVVGTPRLQTIRKGIAVYRE